MEKFIIIVLGAVLFITALMEKFHIWFRIEKFGASQKRKFIYDLSQCRFCVTFHLCVIVSLLYIAATGIGFENMIFVPIISGLTTLKKT